MGLERQLILFSQIEIKSLLKKTTDAETSTCRFISALYPIANCNVVLWPIQVSLTGSQQHSKVITLFYGDQLFDSQGPCTDKKKYYNKWGNLWYLVSPQWNLVSFLDKLVKWTTLLILNFTTFFKTCRCFFFLLFFGLVYEFCHDMWRKGGLDSLQEGVFLWCQWAGIFFLDHWLTSKISHHLFGQKWTIIPW